MCTVPACNYIHVMCTPLHLHRLFSLVRSFDSRRFVYTAWNVDRGCNVYHFYICFIVLCRMFLCVPCMNIYLNTYTARRPRPRPQPNIQLVLTWKNMYRFRIRKTEPYKLASKCFRRHNRSTVSTSVRPHILPIKFRLPLSRCCLYINDMLRKENTNERN